MLFRSTHTSLMTMIPGLNTNFASSIPSGDWGLFIDSGNSNKLTRQDSLGNKVVVEAGVPVVLSQSESALPATPAAGLYSCWADSTDHTGLECMTNNSATRFNLIQRGLNGIVKESSAAVTSAAAAADVVGLFSGCSVGTQYLGADGTCHTPAGGSGITQLTGDVTAGPGSGSVAATVAKINGTTVPTNTVADQALVTTAEIGRAHV